MCLGSRQFQAYLLSFIATHLHPSIFSFLCLNQEEILLLTKQPMSKEHIASKGPMEARHMSTFVDLSKLISLGLFTKKIRPPPSPLSSAAKLLQEAN